MKYIYPSSIILKWCSSKALVNLLIHTNNWCVDNYYQLNIHCMILCFQVSSLNYTLSVTRLPTYNDVMEEQSQSCKLCPESVKRTLKTMLDTTLLSSPSFLILCISGFITMMGFYVPFMYIKGC